MKKLLSGNVAIAQGAWEAGVVFAAGYPGTPSTEIVETLGHYKEVDAQWAANEKVAFDEAMGAAIGGVRALVAMKHVGLNVAADSFMVFPYAGTNAGFVVVSADDPGTYSSQNEQDNRYFAKFGKVPLLEPSDAQECHDFVKFAFDLSERFETPVMLRTTMRTSHTKGLVEIGPRVEVPPRKFQRNNQRWVVPPHARLRRPTVEERLRKLEAYAEECPLNREEPGLPGEGPPMGIITSGIAYQYVREVAPEATVLKLGMTFPLPKQKILDFCKRFDTVYIVEESEPFLEEQIRFWGVQNVKGKDLFPNIGELSPEIVAKALKGQDAPGDYSREIGIIPRPPMLCVGCPHRGTFFALKRLGVLVTGDIGCYTLGGLPPYGSLHTTFCMGASIGNAFGFERAGEKDVVAVIGDSTFVHAGIPSLIDAVYNKSRTTVIIADNGTTGMTGHEDHPATGRTLKGEVTKKLDLEALCRVVGVEWVRVVDPMDNAAMEAAVKEALAFPGPAVVIARRNCVLIPAEKARKRIPYQVAEGECIACSACLECGCPALEEQPDGTVQINAIACAACGLCSQLCPVEAIRGGMVV